MQKVNNEIPSDVLRDINKRLRYYNGEYGVHRNKHSDVGMKEIKKDLLNDIDTLCTYRLFGERDGKGVSTKYREVYLNMNNRFKGFLTEDILRVLSNHKEYLLDFLKFTFQSYCKTPSHHRGNEKIILQWFKKYVKNFNIFSNDDIENFKDMNQIHHLYFILSQGGEIFNQNKISSIISFCTVNSGKIKEDISFDTIIKDYNKKYYKEIQFSSYSLFLSNYSIKNLILHDYITWEHFLGILKKTPDDRKFTKKKTVSKRNYLDGGNFEYITYNLIKIPIHPCIINIGEEFIHQKGKMKNPATGKYIPKPDIINSFRNYTIINETKVYEMIDLFLKYHKNDKDYKEKKEKIISLVTNNHLQSSRRNLVKILSLHI